MNLATSPVAEGASGAALALSDPTARGVHADATLFAPARLSAKAVDRVRADHSLRFAGVARADGDCYLHDVVWQDERDGPDRDDRSRNRVSFSFASPTTEQGAGAVPFRNLTRVFRPLADIVADAEHIINIRPKWYEARARRVLLPHVS